MSQKFAKVFLAFCLLAVGIAVGFGAVYGLHARHILDEEKTLGGEPFFFPGKDNDKAVLFIHGFAATPYDLRPVGEYLAKRGIASYAPLLKGHGTSASDLKNTGWRDWLAGPEDALRELSGKYKKVYLVGFSMGGDIALDLAARHEVAGVVLLAPCVFLKGHDRFITPETLIKDFSYFMLTDYVIKDEKGSAYNPVVVKARPAYRLFPLKSLSSLVEYMNLTRDELPRVSEPVLVIQSANDNTVDGAGPSYVMGHVSSADKSVFWVTRSRHVLTLDYERDRVIEKVYEFVAKH